MLLFTSCISRVFCLGSYTLNLLLQVYQASWHNLSVLGPEWTVLVLTYVVIRPAKQTYSTLLFYHYPVQVITLTKHFFPSCYYNLTYWYITYIW